MDATWPDRSCRRTERLLGTFVTLEVVYPADEAGGPDPTAAIVRAFEWIQAVERCCSRFDAASELRRLCDTVGTPVRVNITSGVMATAFVVAAMEIVSGSSGHVPSAWRVSNSASMRVPRTTTTRVSSAWLASMSILLPMGHVLCASPANLPIGSPLR